MSCNQRCIHPRTSASSHAGATVPRALTEGGSGQVPGENSSLHKSDCPVVALVEMAESQAVLLRLLEDVMGPGVNKIPPSVQQILLRATTCGELWTLRIQLFW